MLWSMMSRMYQVKKKKRITSVYSPLCLWQQCWGVSSLFICGNPWDRRFYQRPHTAYKPEESLIAPTYIFLQKDHLQNQGENVPFHPVCWISVFFCGRVEHYWWVTVQTLTAPQSDAITQKSTFRSRLNIFCSSLTFQEAYWFSLQNNGVFLMIKMKHWPFNWPHLHIHSKTWFLFH